MSLDGIEPGELCGIDPPLPSAEPEEPGGCYPGRLATDEPGTRNAMKQRGCAHARTARAAQAEEARAGDP